MSEYGTYIYIYMKHILKYFCSTCKDGLNIISTVSPLNSIGSYDKIGAVFDVFNRFAGGHKYFSDTLKLAFLYVVSHRSIISVHSFRPEDAYICIGALGHHWFI